MKKLIALLFVPSAIVMIAGCSSPKKQMPVDGIRQIETIEMTAARVRGEKYTPPTRTPRAERPAPAVSETSEDLLPPESAVEVGPELDGEGDWVDGELPGLPEPVPRADDVAEQMGALGGAEITEEVVGEWRTVGSAVPADYTAPAPEEAMVSKAPAAAPAGATARASKARADAEARIRAQASSMSSSRASATDRVRSKRPGSPTAPAIDSPDSGSAPDYPEGELPDFRAPDQPFQPSFLPIPTFGTEVDTDVQPAGPAAPPGISDVSVGKAATSETVMVGSRPVTLNFVNGEWVGPQGETYSQLPIVGELLPRYGN